MDATRDTDALPPARLKIFAKGAELELLERPGRIVGIRRCEADLLLALFEIRKSARARDPSSLGWAAPDVRNRRFRRIHKHKVEDSTIASYGSRIVRALAAKLGDNAPLLIESNRAKGSRLARDLVVVFETGGHVDEESD